VRSTTSTATTANAPSAVEIPRLLAVVSTRTDLPVFLLGASGSGKTHAARQIHERSGLKGHFVIINCARLPTDIGQLHSELLGHVKGGFTGAVGDRVGKLLHANGWTLFLDEVESLPDVAQGFLLDLLEGTGDIAAFGASPAKVALPPPRFRLISASKAALAASGLRRDLCERLAQGYMWKVPSLEDRRDDIPGLIETFLLEQRETRGIQATFSEDAIAFSVAQQWPGQVRELRAMVVALVQAANARNDANGRAGEPVHIGVAEVRARLREREEVFDGAPAPEDDESGRPTWVAPVHGSQRAAHAREESGENLAVVVQTTAVSVTDSPRPIHPRALTREDVVAALQSAGGNKSAAARALGVARNTLAARMRTFGLSGD
jgi:DNA-binding NtrC family response regulator